MIATFLRQFELEVCGGACVNVEFSHNMQPDDQCVT
jgi:hypothetical protein